MGRRLRGPVDADESIKHLPDRQRQQNLVLRHDLADVVNQLPSVRSRRPRRVALRPPPAVTAASITRVGQHPKHALKAAETLQQRFGVSSWLLAHAPPPVEFFPLRERPLLVLHDPPLQCYGPAET